MAHIRPVSREAVPEGEEVFRLVEEMLGFVPNALLTLAKRPAILRSLGQLVRAVMREGQLDPALRMLVAEVASSAAGCHYCQAHAAVGASRFGVDSDKIEAVWDFEHSDRFDDSERAALRLARDAASVPNAVGPQHFEDLSLHFSETEILELVAVVSLFGWFNRWNDTLATELEEPALAFGSRHLEGQHWEAGKHESDAAHLSARRAEGLHSGSGERNNVGSASDGAM